MTEWTQAPLQAQDFPTAPSAPYTGPLYLQREQIIRTPKVAFRGQLTGSSAVLYTAPTLVNSPTSSATGTQATSQIRMIMVSNTDSSARTYTLTIVESGGSVAANRNVFDATSIAAKTTHIYSFDEDQYPLMEGETINGLADTTLKVTLRISVTETTH